MILAEIDVHFHAILLEVQRRFNSVIPDTVKVEEAYSVPIRFSTCNSPSKYNVPIDGKVTNP